MTSDSTHDIAVSMSQHDISTKAGFFLGFLNAMIVTSFLGPKTCAYK